MAKSKLIYLIGWIALTAQAVTFFFVPGSPAVFAFMIVAAVCNIGSIIIRQLEEIYDELKN